MGLLALLSPVAIALADHDTACRSGFQNFNLVCFRDSDDGEFSLTLSDKGTIHLANVAALPSDKAYEGWLVADSGPVSIGILNVTDAVIDQNFTLSGANLFANFHTAVVSIEPVPDPDPAPSADKPYAVTIPADLLAHIRHLTYSWQGNPVYTVGPHAGVPKGIAVGLREQAALAWLHARLGVNSTTLASIQQHAEHTVNIIDGGAGQDLDGVGGAQNPGDKGPGVLGYADDAIKHAEFSHDIVRLSGSGSNSASRTAQEVIDSAGRAKTWAETAKERAMAALGTTELIVARAAIANASVLLDKTLDKTLNEFDTDGDGTIERIVVEGGAKQAYWASQELGNYVLPGAADTAVTQPTPKPPDTGDSSVPGLAFPGLILGIILLAVGGAVLYGLSRRRGSVV